PQHESKNDSNQYYVQPDPCFGRGACRVRYGVFLGLVSVPESNPPLCPQVDNGGAYRDVHRCHFESIISNLVSCLKLGHGKFTLKNDVTVLFVGGIDACWKWRRAVYKRRLHDHNDIAIACSTPMYPEG